jgi:hypothetical protein
MQRRVRRGGGEYVEDEDGNAYNNAGMTVSMPSNCCQCAICTYSDRTFFIHICLFKQEWNALCDRLATLGGFTTAVSLLNLRQDAGFLPELWMRAWFLDARDLFRLGRVNREGAVGSALSPTLARHGERGAVRARGVRPRHVIL